MDPTEHLRLFSSGNGDLARYWRNEQARLINEELNPWGAIMVDIWDIEIRFGMKYAQGIAELLNYAATIWPPEQFPLR